MPLACKLQKWRDVYPWDWKMHNSNLICTEAAARWRIAHCMFMNRNHYGDWGACRHGPVTQNFFIVYLARTAALKSSRVKTFSTVWLWFSCGHFQLGFIIFLRVTFKSFSLKSRLDAENKLAVTAAPQLFLQRPRLLSDEPLQYMCQPAHRGQKQMFSSF